MIAGFAPSPDFMPGDGDEPHVEAGDGNPCALAALPRQPERLYITPSKPNPWYGTIVEGDPLTIEQRRALAQQQLDPAKIETLKVRREATSREFYWGRNQAPPVFAFDCPVLDRRRDGKIRVIAPGGWAELILPNGWVRPPHPENLRQFA